MGLDTNAKKSKLKLFSKIFFAGLIVFILKKAVSARKRKAGV